MALAASAGSYSRMLKSAAAGPVGRRRSCSQFCNVFTLTPINWANSDCDRLVRSRIDRTPAARITVRPESLRSPRRIAPASRTLPSSSSNIRCFTAKLLFDDPGEFRNLFRSQIRRSIFRICVEQEDHVFSNRPIVDDAGAAALSPRSNRNSHLAYPAAAPDGSTGFRVRSDPELKLAILLIAQQNRDLLRKDGSLNQFHFALLSASGGHQSRLASGLFLAALRLKIHPFEAQGLPVLAVQTRRPAGCPPRARAGSTS